MKIPFSESAWDDYLYWQKAANFLSVLVTSITRSI